MVVFLVIVLGSSGLRWWTRSNRSKRWSSSTRSEENYRSAVKKQDKTGEENPDQLNFRADNQTILIVKHGNDLEVANACVDFYKDNLRRKLALLSTKDELFESGQFGVMPAHHGAVEVVGPKNWPRPQAEALTLHLSQKFNTLAVHTWNNDDSGEWLLTACENGEKKFHASMALKGNLANAEATITTEGNEWATGRGFKPGAEGFKEFDEDDANRLLKKLGIKLWDRTDESFSYTMKQ
jgi:hypothetical protein